VLNIAIVVATKLFAGKLHNNLSEHSPETTLTIFSLAIALGIANALCQASTFSCKYQRTPIAVEM